MDLTNFKDILKEITSKYYTKWCTKTFGKQWNWWFPGKIEIKIDPNLLIQWIDSRKSSWFLVNNQEIKRKFLRFIFQTTSAL